ncbi:MAG: Forkhead box protein P4, partial [Marteilia pararefringens]
MIDFHFRCPFDDCQKTIVIQSNCDSSNKLFEHLLDSHCGNKSDVEALLHETRKIATIHKNAEASINKSIQSISRNLAIEKCDHDNVRVWFNDAKIKLEFESVSSGNSPEDLSVDIRDKYAGNICQGDDDRDSSVICDNVDIISDNQSKKASQIFLWRAKEGQRVESGNEFRQRPKLTYADLIKEALDASENNCLSLKEIYRWIENRYPYFKSTKCDWRNAVRHNLSSYKFFWRSSLNSEIAVHPDNCFLGTNGHVIAGNVWKCDNEEFLKHKASAYTRKSKNLRRREANCSSDGSETII